MKLRRRSGTRQRRSKVSASFRRRPPELPTRGGGFAAVNDPPEVLALGIGGPVVSPYHPSRRPALADLSEPPPSTGDIGERIRVLEARLDGMLQTATVHGGDPPRRAMTSPPSPAAKEASGEEADPVLSSPFYRRRWGTAGPRRTAQHVDEFGLDPDYEDRRVRPLLRLLYRYYFRVRVQGIENVPATGRCLVAANHSGAIPLDGPVLRTATHLDHPQHRDLRWLAEDLPYRLPFVGTAITRVGAVRACPENVERLLKNEHCVAVFPEGSHGISKLYRERYRLQRFGRGDFVRLALQMGAPIVPCAIIGAEEASPLLFREQMFSRWLGFPYLPVTPVFPWLGPVGLVPAPTRWSIYFDEPLEFHEYGPGAAEDDVLVGRLTEHIHTRLQHMIDEGLKARRSVWWG